MLLHSQYFDDFDYVLTYFDDLENYDILVNLKDSDFKFNDHFSSDFMNIDYVTSHLLTIEGSITST